MKGITSIVLLLFFLAGNSYGALNIHYCGGKLKSVSQSKGESCGKCGKPSSKSCCKDVQKVIKADDFSKNNSNWSFKAFFVALLPQVYQAFYQALFTGLETAAQYLIWDIPQSKTPTFIRIHSIII